MDPVFLGQYSYKVTFAPAIARPVPRKPKAVAQIIYGGHSMALLGAVLYGSNGPFQMSASAWRLKQMLEQNGSRFI